LEELQSVAGVLALRHALACMEGSERFKLLLSLLDSAATTRFENGQNTVLRNVPKAGVRRSERVELSMRASALDTGFVEAIHQADDARDARDWELGMALYGKGISIYPYQYGYIVQRGHCLKELCYFIEAEICYRDALAFGAPLNDVWEHLDFVAKKNGYYKEPYPSKICAHLRVDKATTPWECWRDELTVSREVLQLSKLLYGDIAVGPVWVLKGLRAAPEKALAIPWMLEDPFLSTFNSHLLSWLSRNGLAADA